MKKYGVFAVCILALFCASAALAAPGEKQIKAMSLFLSNFTELGFMEASTEEMAKPENYPDLVRFGVWHNYINNFKSRIERNDAKSQKHGDVRIKASWVEESVLKFFGLKVTADRSVDQSYPPYYFDAAKKAFHFWAADGEAAWYARVKNAESPEKGVWNLSGEIYNADDPKELWGDFEAVIRESDWKGKPSYVLVSIRSEMK